MQVIWKVPRENLKAWEGALHDIRWNQSNKCKI